MFWLTLYLSAMRIPNVFAVARVIAVYGCLAFSCVFNPDQNLIYTKPGTSGHAVEERLWLLMPSLSLPTVPTPTKHRSCLDMAACTRAAALWKLYTSNELKTY